MRILVVHEVSYTLKPVFEYQELADLLSDSGHDVAVFHFDEGPGKLFLDRPLRSSAMRLFPERTITTFSSGFGGTSLAARLLAAIAALLFLPAAIAKFKPDIILNYSVPTFGITANFVAFLSRTPIVYRALDVSHRIRRTKLAPLVRAAERFVYSFSSHISTHNVALAAYCENQSLRSTRASIEYPPVQDQFFEECSMTKEEARASLGLPPSTAKVYLVLGTLFEFCGVDKLIPIFENLSGSTDHLLIVGSGPLESRVRSLANDTRRVHLKPLVDFFSITKVFCSADFTLIPFDPSLEADCALPQRAILSLAAGVPVISLPLKGLSAEFGSDGVIISPTLEAMFEIAAQNSRHSRNQISIRRKVGTEPVLAKFDQMLRQVISGRVREDSIETTGMIGR